MSNRVLKSNLSTEGLQIVIEQLQKYSADLPVIADRIVRRLAERGLKVAEYSVYADWRQCIEFLYIPMRLGTGNVTAREIAPLHRVWYSKSGAISGEADISPLLMSEYGAGPYALTGHRGTFPGQHNAFKSEWFWYDINGHKHSSEEDYHMVATRPMYNALVDMIVNAERVAKEVFKAYEL